DPPADPRFDPVTLAREPMLLVDLRDRQVPVVDVVTGYEDVELGRVGCERLEHELRGGRLDRARGLGGGDECRESVGREALDQPWPANDLPERVRCIGRKVLRLPIEEAVDGATTLGRGVVIPDRSCR